MACASTESQADGSTSDADDDFKFCILGKGAETGMCVADEVFSDGKLVPLRPYLPPGSDGPTYILPPRSTESAACTADSGPQSDSRSASSSSSSSSGCVSRSQSSESASSEAPRRRSLSSSLLYAHPSPSPQLRRTVPRRSTGSAPRGVLRLGVAGAPDVYPPRPRDTKSAAVAASRDGGSKSARFELQASAAAAASRDGRSKSARFEQASAAAVDRKVGPGLFSDILGCNCSSDAVEPVRLPAKRSGKKDGMKKSGGRRTWILHWLEELSTIAREKK